MSRVSKHPLAAALTGEGPLTEFAISQQQIDAAARPAQSVGALLAPSPQPRRLGRPWLVWKDDLELARTVNDRLAAHAS